MLDFYRDPPPSNEHTATGDPKLLQVVVVCVCVYMRVCVCVSDASLSFPLCCSISTLRAAPGF